MGQPGCVTKVRNRGIILRQLISTAKSFKGLYMFTVNAREAVKQMADHGDGSVETVELSPPHSTVTSDQGSITSREIVELGYDVANPELIGREDARQVLIDLFFGMSNTKLLLIEKPMRVAFEAGGAFVDAETIPFVIISSARQHFLDFVLMSEHSKQCISLQNAGDGINTYLKHNAAAFDRSDTNGMYFQYQALGVTWPCTVGIFPDAETTFSVYQKLESR